MTDSSNPYRRPAADLDFLTSHPSLLGLSGCGWRLDRLPATSTGLAFAGAVLVSLVTSGYPTAGLLVVGTVLGTLLVASAALRRDMTATRITMHAVRIGLVAWMVFCAAFIHPVTN